MEGGKRSRRVSVSGLLMAGDLIDLDQPAGSGLLKEDSFLMDSDLDTEIFDTSPPKAQPEGASSQPPASQKDESLHETKARKSQPSRNRMRSSMAWDQAFQVDESALFLQDPSPLDTTSLSEAPAPPRTTKRPAAIAIPLKSFQTQEAEARPRTPSDATPFLELQSNTPILSTGPSPKPQASGGRRRKDLVQASMAWNGAFEEEKEGALLTDDLPLAESPVLPTRRRSLGKRPELLESSDSSMTGVHRSLPQRTNANRASMAWDRAFQSSEGVLDVDEVDEISDSKAFRASELVSQSVLSSIDSLRTEASASSVAGPSVASVDEEVESEGDKKERSELEGSFVGNTLDQSSTPVKVTPTKGGRRRKQLASLHRPSSTAVAIETAIQHGTRLRLPGRYNPNPLPPSKPKPSARTPEPSSAESARSTRLEDSSRVETTSGAEGASKEIPGDQSPGASSQFEALQAQLAAMARERDALRAKVSKLEGSSDKQPPRKSPVEPETSVEPAGQGQGEFRGVNKRAIEGKGVQNGEEDSALGRPKTRLMALRSQPPVEVTASKPQTVTPVQVALPRAVTKDGPTLESEPSTSSNSGASLRPSFLRRPAAKRDFFQAPTRVTLQSPIKPSVSSIRKASTDSAAVPSPARPSRASADAGSGGHSAAESLKGPAVARTRSFSSGNPPSSPSPAPSPRPSPVPASPKASQISLPRYQSFLRKPSAKGASAVGQLRTLKSGTFSSSAIQAACAVPLPSSPGVASPSPLKKPAARAHVGAIPPSSPAASRLCRSGDKPPTNPSPGGTSKLPSGAKKGSASEAPKTGGEATNTFMSKLAAASGSQSRIPSLGSSRLKPPGLKPPAKPSALPRPSSIDPAVLAAACAIPLPGSPKTSKPRSLLPRDMSAAAIAAACAVPLPPSPKPVQARPSRLRPPSVVTAALVKAACAVPLPPSPKSSKTTKPAQGTAEQSLEAGGKSPQVKERVSKAAGGEAREERESLGAEEKFVAVPVEETGREGGKRDRADFKMTHTGDAAARILVDASSTNKSLPAKGEMGPMEGSGAATSAVGEHLPTSSTGTPRAGDTLFPPTQKANPSSPAANQTPKPPLVPDTLALSPPSPPSHTCHVAPPEAAEAAIAYPSLQLPSSSCSQPRRLSRKPNLPTIYSPLPAAARGLFTPELPAEGDHEVEESKPKSPVARALFSSRLGRAARVVTQEEEEKEEASVPPAVHTEAGANGSDSDMESPKTVDGQSDCADEPRGEPESESLSVNLERPIEGTGQPAVEKESEEGGFSSPLESSTAAAEELQSSSVEAPEEVFEKKEKPSEKTDGMGEGADFDEEFAAAEVLAREVEQNLEGTGAELKNNPVEAPEEESVTESPKPSERSDEPGEDATPDKEASTPGIAEGLAGGVKQDLDGTEDELKISVVEAPAEGLNKREEQSERSGALCSDAAWGEDVVGSGGIDGLAGAVELGGEGTGDELKKSPVKSPEKVDKEEKKLLDESDELGEDAVSGLRSNPARSEGLEQGLEVTGVELKSSPVGAPEEILEQPGELSGRSDGLGEGAASGLEVSKAAALEGLEGRVEQGLQVTGDEMSSSPVKAPEAVLVEEDKLVEGSEGLPEDSAVGAEASEVGAVEKLVEKAEQGLEVTRIAVKIVSVEAPGNAFGKEEKPLSEGPAEDVVAGVGGAGTGESNGLAGEVEQGLEENEDATPKAEKEGAQRHVSQADGIVKSERVEATEGVKGLGGDASSEVRDEELEEGMVGDVSTGASAWSGSPECMEQNGSEAAKGPVGGVNRAEFFGSLQTEPQTLSVAQSAAVEEGSPLGGVDEDGTPSPTSVLLLVEDASESDSEMDSPRDPDPEVEAMEAETLDAEEEPCAGVVLSGGGESAGAEEGEAVEGRDSELESPLQSSADVITMSSPEMAQLLRLEAKLLGTLGQESPRSGDTGSRSTAEPLTEGEGSPIHAGTAADVTVKAGEGEDEPASDRGVSANRNSAEQEGGADDVIGGGPSGRHEDGPLALCGKVEPVERRHLEAGVNGMEADVIVDEAQDSCGRAQDVPGGTPGELTRDPSPQPKKVSVLAKSDGAGASDLLARLRARQAAVEALLDSPRKVEASVQKEAPSEELARQGPDKQQSNFEVQSPRTSQRKGDAAARLAPQGEEKREGEGLSSFVKESGGESQPKELRFARLAEPGSGWQEKEGVLVSNVQSPGASPKSAQTAEQGGNAADVLLVSISNADGSEGKAGASAPIQGTAEVETEQMTSSQSALTLPIADQSPQLATNKEPTQKAVRLEAEHSGSSSVTTEENRSKSNSVTSPGGMRIGATSVNSPVSAVWEETWFGTPSRLPKKSSGKRTGRNRGGKASPKEESTRSSGEEPKVPGSSEKGDGSSVGDVVVTGILGDEGAVGDLLRTEGASDRAPVEQSEDGLQEEALSEQQQSAPTSSEPSGQDVFQKLPPETPNLLSLAIPLFLNPETPGNQPRQTLESQFDGQAESVRDETEVLWDECLARVKGKRRSSPVLGQPRTPLGKRTPMRRSAEDLWGCVASGRPGASPGTPNRGSPVSILTRTPGRMNCALSESAPGLAGLMQSLMEGSARKVDKVGGWKTSPAVLGASPVARPREKMPGRRKKPVLSPVEVSWDGEELEARIRAIEAGGEAALSSKSGRVQSSPPNKKEEEPANPYSPVKKQECGPFDCTKKSVSK